MTVLAIRDLHKTFGPRLVLRGLCLDVDAGEVVALEGDNGSGKSTALAIASSVLCADRGDVIVGGRSLREARTKVLARVGYAPSHGSWPASMLASEWVGLAAALRRASPMRAEAMSAWEIGPFARSTLGSLSLGQARRLLLACATSLGADVWLLDEPTVGLDESGQQRLARAIEDLTARGGSVLMTSHDERFSARVGATRWRLVDGRAHRAAA